MITAMWGFMRFVLALAAQVGIVVGLAWVFVPPVVQEWEDADHRGLAVVKIARVVVSLVAAVYFAVTYGTQISSYEMGVGLTFVKYLGGSVIMLVFVPVILSWLLIFARQLGINRRKLLKLSFVKIDSDGQYVDTGFHLGMMSAVIAYLLGMGGFLLLTGYLYETMENWLYRQWPPVQLVLGLVALLWLTVVVIIVAVTGFAAMESGFNAAVTHPYIPPVLGFIFLVTLAFGDRIWVHIPVFNEALNPSSNYVNMGSYDNPAQWAALVWALVIAVIEVVIARRKLQRKPPVIYDKYTY